MTYEKLSNEQLINLCNHLLKIVLETENTLEEAYHLEDRKTLEDATNELQKRAGLNRDRADFDDYDSSDFARLIEKAMVAIKVK